MKQKVIFDVFKGVLVVIVLSFMMMFIWGGCTHPSTPDPDDTSLKISRITVTNIDENTVNIAWVTNDSADGIIYYGLENLDKNERHTNYSEDHELTLSNLYAQSEYQYRIVSQNEDEVTQTNISSFTTLNDTTAPLILNIITGSVTSTSITVVWETNEPTISFLNYGTIAPIEYGPFYSHNGSTSLTHMVVLNDLEPETSYQIRVTAEDNFGNSAYANTIYVTTKATPKIGFFPDEITKAVGDTFSIGIEITIEDLYQATLEFQYDYTHIRYEGHTAGPFFYENNTGEGSLHEMNDYLTTGYKKIVATWPVDYDEIDPNVPIGTLADGTGIIAYLKFTAINPLDGGNTVIRYIREDRFEPFSGPDSHLDDVFMNSMNAEWDSCMIYITR